MKTYLTLAVAFTFVFAFAVTPPVRAESAGISKIEDSIGVLRSMVSIPERAIPPALLRNASGIAIVPNVIKAGFIVGGRYGTGVLLVRDKEGRWSNPSFITVAGGSIGWQIGVESIDIILVFKHESTINRMLTGKFTLGVDASVAAGPVGREASAATDVQLKSEIYSYSRSRGLFAGLALSGAVLQIDDDDNASFYGEKDIFARDIFMNRVPHVPPVVHRLKELLTDYTGKTSR
ncbi:MAG: lipid-binding SYLF domain-containing protein [Nitrospirae bacterium]|nr:lipid-binding SYLF domain-containing protein [Nitrospirota bacterium]